VNIELSVEETAFQYVGIPSKLLRSQRLVNVDSCHKSVTKQTAQFCAFYPDHAWYPKYFSVFRTNLSSHNRHELH